jgi:hypothetical protein
MDSSENENMIMNENKLNDNEIIIEEDVGKIKRKCKFSKRHKQTRRK